MIERCANPRSIGYKNYGERGIRVCETWKAFANFLHDMGTKPIGHTLNRIDTNEPYAPENCRWATRKDQSRNTRRTRTLTLHGRTQCLKDWAQEAGVNYGTFLSRIDRLGWSIEDALGLSNERVISLYAA
jgi:hypothetical protein